jgi:hypothetical protein
MSDLRHIHDPVLSSLWMEGIRLLILFFFSYDQTKVGDSQRRGTARTLPHYLLFGLFGCNLCFSVYCLCVNVYCHRVTTQLQLINISVLLLYLQ